MSPLRRGDPAAVVPDAEPRSYYDQPVLERHVWTFEVPLYFFAGGVAGASSVVAAVARAADDLELARVAERAAAVGAVVSPVLLISDLGRPGRFLNMLRVFKVTSPMSVGSWILVAYAPMAVGTTLLAELDRAPTLRRLASTAAAALGPFLATYTAVLLADTAVPVWHDARRELPFAFAGGAVQGAAGIAIAALPPERAGAARRLLVAGAVLREVADAALDRRLAGGADVRHAGRAGRWHAASRALSAAGVVAGLTAGRRHRPVAVAGGALAAAGAAAERFSVFAAGTASASDPQATIGPQRRRVEERRSTP